MRLLERAAAISSAPTLPNLERVDTFRFYGDGGVQEGTFTRVVIQGTGRRDETTLGDYHTVDVFTSGQMATTRAREIPPQAILDLRILTPVYLVHFDGKDVIRAIVNSEVAGRAARCNRV